MSSYVAGQLSYVVGIPFQDCAEKGIRRAWWEQGWLMARERS